MSFWRVAAGLGWAAGLLLLANERMSARREAASGLGQSGKGQLFGNHIHTHTQPCSLNVAERLRVELDMFEREKAESQGRVSVVETSCDDDDDNNPARTRGNKVKPRQKRRRF